jgi:hypothetical protein
MAADGDKSPLFSINWRRVILDEVSHVVMIYIYIYMYIYAYARIIMIDRDI